MNLTRPLSSRVLRNTTKAGAALRHLSLSRTITMGALNGHAHGADAKQQNGARANLVPMAARLEEGRALAEDVWSIFK